MINPADQEKIKTWAKQQISIYFSFFMALIMYTAVMFIVTRGRNIDTVSAVMTLRNVLIVVSILIAGAKFWVQTRFQAEVKSYETCQSIDEIIQKFTKYQFIQYALGETPALFGLIIAFVTMRLEQWWLFFGISVILFATSVPTGSRLERIVNANAMRHQM